MIKGVEVTVVRPSEKTKDRLGEEVAGAETREAVGNVLISPPTTADLEAARQDGYTVALTLHFPKTYEAGLQGCEVELPAPWGGVYRVIGNPLPLMAENTPGAWNRPVNVEVCNG
jgi:hypothetical protein